MGSNITRESVPTISRNGSHRESTSREGTPRESTSQESASRENMSRESTCQDIESASNSYRVVKHAKVLGKTFHEAGATLPHLSAMLRSLQFGGDESWTEALSRKARMTKTVCDTVANVPDAKKLKSYKMAVRQVSDGMTVEALVIGMMEHICDAAKNDPSERSMEDQVRQLRDTIDKLSQMESSIPKEIHHFVAHDNAHQFNALGGDQNNLLGSGTQFIRSHFDGGITHGSR
ncbi:hypothetical protein FHL15_005490 [Xylaria flabelliformis]|uniref:NACHT-NTPase and P-loop NTPases N-terminal domain-containing protein n=1 Tax=Xylaria flabelliformis TaxID=2512241 RepID=A0A553HZZ2_9PEZI|nr:hypothetical protein FHL15_005490 [Xylaria flabelliformis]